ncbi:MAG: O-methyltransferase [Anaerorhabdus sp.]
MEKLEQLKQYAYENDVPIMMDDGIDFLCQYIQEVKCKAILECGTAIGYSAIRMALLDGSITIDTCELKDEFVAIAQKNIEEKGLTRQITVHQGDALEFITDKKYDLIFVDAAKSKYRQYMEHFEKNLKDGGQFVFDNLEFHGMVNQPQLAKSRNTRQLVRKIKCFREYLLSEKRLDTKYFPQIGDGIAVVKLKKSKID